MRTGDTVHHNPTGETWVVAWADDYELIPCGWPETVADITDCELLEACGDAEYWHLVEAIAQGGTGSIRQRRCFQLFESRRQAECAAIMRL